MLKSDIIWPSSRRFKTKSQWEPVGFFSECLCNSTSFDLMLGFFSSSAISILADGFATFLHNGGRMRLIINDILTVSDKNAIEKGVGTDFIKAIDLSNLELLKDTLSDRDKHFFECLAWLIRNNRIDIKIIAPASGEGIAHTKCGVFCDGISKVAFDGSVNFSRTALLDNKESLTASCSWDGEVEEAKIRDTEEEFKMTFNGKDESVKYIDAKNIKIRLTSMFPDKELSDLLEDEYKILNGRRDDGLPPSVRKALENAKIKVDAAIKKSKKTDNTPEDRANPHFPYPSGPRDYQTDAFENWKKNKQKGLFVMATGTGKTITSLNCLLQIFNHSGSYKAIILVPTVTLLEQWQKECEKFNFKGIIKVCSKYNNWRHDVASIRIAEVANPNNKLSYIIISTYASFVRSNVFFELNQFPTTKLLLIADEAHNMGAGQMVGRLNDIKYLRRIGLTATPERQFDEMGYQRLMNFFGCSDGYTFEYSMAKAIEKGALCKYYYYPHIVNLTKEELENYCDITKKIVRVYGHQDHDSQELLKILLLKRKRIIHKAENKKNVLKSILTNRFNEKKSLKYTLVYVPEGNMPDDQTSDIYDKTDLLLEDEDALHLINEYTRIVKDIDSHIVVRQFTSESTDRENMLSQFARGDIDVLTSMKCLDEGVDVPRSELAIFCSSTGNPRQFIQRRGRILRTHKDKKFAVIHDLVVAPLIEESSETYALEKSLVESEMKRVRNFASLSENLIDTANEIHEILEHYNLSIFN